MSLAAIRARACQRVALWKLSDPAYTDLVAVVAANQAPLLQFLLEAGIEAGLARDHALGRAAGVALHLAALQLADDLADGDCDYLEPATAAGPAAQYLLQNLFVIAMVEDGVPSRALARACLHFARGGAPQLFEVRTRTWTFEQAKALALGFGGEYMIGNLTLMWAGTSLANQAESVGMPLGIAAHVSSELRSIDRRFFALSEPARAALVAWARESAHAADCGLACVSRVLGPIEDMLDRAQEQLRCASPG